MNLANYAQFEREMISERTRDALRHLKSQGVRLGPAPYGYALSDDVDATGGGFWFRFLMNRRWLRRSRECGPRGSSFTQIARRLNEAKIPAAGWRLASEAT